MSYANLQGQRSMALDATRNPVYERALKACVNTDSAVLDLGAGIGIFGLLALKHGARQVYAVEPQAIGTLAHEIAAANGWGDRLKVLHGRIEEIELPEKVDVIVSAMTGNLLFNEDLLPTLFNARDRFLKPDGMMVPSAAAIDAVLVQSPKIADRQLESWARPHLGIDMSAPRRYAANSIAFREPSLRDAEALGEPAELFRMDLTSASYEKLDATVELAVAESGRANGVGAWLRMELGDEWLSTGPFDPKVHWSPAWIPLDPPLDVERGETGTLRIMRPPHGDWVWQYKHGGLTRQGSTRFARPLGSLSTRRRSDTPAATRRAAAVAFVIGAMDGTTRRETIAARVIDEFADLFPTAEKATAFVEQITRVHGSS
ncbi:MAG: methyltransferase domain-containing protein [Acidobacteria bacterium]|nr:methyltransferase domain-containing protein [Acidobacteriota bacterium]